MAPSFASPVAALAVCLIVSICNIRSAQAQTYTERVLYSFTGLTDGACPESGVLIRDGQGNLYGTTEVGGASDYGTVFQLQANGTEEVLYSFSGGSDGANPKAGLVLDSAGNLYGTTVYGGSAFGSSGLGTVFKVDATGTEIVFHTFTGSPDAATPGDAALLLDPAGNFFGTTEAGGVPKKGCYSTGCGALFGMDPSGGLTILRDVSRSEDSHLVRTASGRFYGTSYPGSGKAKGFGRVYTVNTSGSLKVLHTFTGAPDGSDPAAGLIRDAAGNLYGTTAQGGSTTERSCFGHGGCGTVFKIDRTGHETVLYRFTGPPNDGLGPVAGLVRDKAGNLYGTTEVGGNSTAQNCPEGCGTVFELDTTGKETVLYSFGGMPEAGYPKGLMRDDKGNLYGATCSQGSNNEGSVFELSPR